MRSEKNSVKGNVNRTPVVLIELPDGTTMGGQVRYESGMVYIGTIKLYSTDISRPLIIQEVIDVG